jgi:hypothetical protein
MDPKVIIPFGWLSRDGNLLLAARILRTFAYGFVSIILASTKSYIPNVILLFLTSVTH